MSASETPGFRLSLTQLERAARSVPLPSFSSPPPSPVTLLSSSGTPRMSATSPASWASPSWTCLLPHPLNRTRPAASSPTAPTRNSGRVSLAHRSSTGPSINSTSEPTRSAAMARDSGRTSIRTASKPAMASAMLAIDSCTPRRSRPQTSALAGKHIHVAACGCSSAGIHHPPSGTGPAEDTEPAGPVLARSSEHAAKARPSALKAETDRNRRRPSLAVRYPEVKVEAVSHAMGCPTVGRMEPGRTHRTRSRPRGSPAPEHVQSPILFQNWPRPRTRMRSAVHLSHLTQRDQGRSGAKGTGQYECAATPAAAHSYRDAGCSAIGEARQGP